MAARANTSNRRAQLTRMQGMRRNLRDLRPCDCPDDCRGHGRVSPPPLHNDDNNVGDDGYLLGQVSRRASARVSSRVLARASGERATTLEGGGGDAQLRMSLQVHTDPQGHHTRLGYYADLFLTPAGQEERHIGYISTWRLSRSAGQQTGQITQPWVGEWLSGDLGGPDDDSRPFKETLRLMYDSTGQLLPMDNALFQPSLSDAGNELVFVEMIWIKHRDATTGFQYSRQRIAAHALGLLYRLLMNGTLPVWYNLVRPITFIMRAGMPSDDGLSEVWLDQYPQQAEEGAQQYSERIADRIERIFQESRYGYVKFSNDHRLLAKVVDDDQERAGSRLEPDVVPAPLPTEPAPRSALSTVRS